MRGARVGYHPPRLLPHAWLTAPVGRKVVQGMQLPGGNEDERYYHLLLHARVTFNAKDMGQVQNGGIPWVDYCVDDESDESTHSFME